MTIRQAGVDDSEGIALVSVSAWRSNYAHILPEEVLANLSVASRAKKVRDRIQEGGSYWVATDSDGVLGFVSVGPNRTTEIGADSEIYSIYVSPAKQHRGIGKRLLRTALPTLISTGSVSLCVFAFRDNVIARRFYTGLGAIELDQSVFKVGDIEYPDQSYFWESIEDLIQRLDSRLQSE